MLCGTYWAENNDVSIYHRKKYLDAKSRIYYMCSGKKRTQWWYLKKISKWSQKNIPLYYKKQLSGTQGNLAFESEYF